METVSGPRSKLSIDPRDKSHRIAQNKSMKSLFFCSFLCWAFAAGAQTASPGKEISGVVRIIRAHPHTEVFFKDLKDSVIIPPGKHHNSIYELCERSWKTGQPVSLKIDPLSRQALPLVESKVPVNEAVESVPGSDRPSTSPGFKSIPDDSSR